MHQKYLAPAVGLHIISKLARAVQQLLGLKYNYKSYLKTRSARPVLATTCPPQATMSIIRAARFTLLPK
jgi:hypothetical protein